MDNDERLFKLARVAAFDERMSKHIKRVEEATGLYGRYDRCTSCLHIRGNHHSGKCMGYNPDGMRSCACVAFVETFDESKQS